MHPSLPHMLPLGYPQPPNDVHAVSVSMPTWNSITGWGRREDRIVGQMQTVYPRFYVHKIVQALADAAKVRLPALLQNANCMVFPSERTAARFCDVMKNEIKDLEFVEVVSFALPSASASNSDEDQWASFYAVFYPGDQVNVQTAASKCWCILGDGISSRHAGFCLERIEYMESVSSNPLYNTAPTSSSENIPAVPWTNSGTEYKEQVKTLIARLASGNGETRLSTNEVFLYPKGMAGINAIARVVSQSIADEAQSEAVVYGWSYAETPKCLPMNNYARFKMYHRGSVQELDELEASLESGRKIAILFCEIPSNPLLETIDIQRIRHLADRFGFIVACDQTLSAFVNLDLLPYVDVLMDSLTKIFSGASNVMGGSVILNPSSKHYSNLHAYLTADFEDIFFPLDAQVLAINSADFEDRIHRCNDNALALATLLSRHPSVQKVYYPNMVGSAPLYEKCRRTASGGGRQEGGYGFLLSIVFNVPSSAVAFYDALDVCKGPSIGTNFTLAVPYAQLAHFKELDWAKECGVDKSIVRISAGLEEERVLVERVRAALRVVEQVEEVGERGAML
ncbi:pyridoxal phosphate-dependent transferase [Aspergillus unguis]